MPLISRIKGHRSLRVDAAAIPPRALHVPQQALLLDDPAASPGYLDRDGCAAVEDVIPLLAWVHRPQDRHDHGDVVSCAVLGVHPAALGAARPRPAAAGLSLAARPYYVCDEVAGLLREAAQHHCLDQTRNIAALGCGADELRDCG